MSFSSNYGHYHISMLWGGYDYQWRYARSCLQWRLERVLVCMSRLQWSEHWWASLIYWIHWKIKSRLFYAYKVDITNAKQRVIEALVWCTYCESDIRVGQRDNYPLTQKQQYALVFSPAFPTLSIQHHGVSRFGSQDQLCLARIEQGSRHWWASKQPVLTSIPSQTHN